MTSQRLTVDVERLIGEVAARNGIRIEPDDPAFALVTLNQLVLEEAARNLVTEIRAATADFKSAAERVQSRAGSMFARMLSERGSKMQTAQRDVEYISGRVAAIWFILGVLCGSIFNLVAVWLGHNWLLTR